MLYSEMKRGLEQDSSAGPNDNSVRPNNNNNNNSARHTDHSVRPNSHSTQTTDNSARPTDNSARPIDSSAFRDISNGSSDRWVLLDDLPSTSSGVYWVPDGTLIYREGVRGEGRVSAATPANGQSEIAVGEEAVPAKRARSEPDAKSASAGANCICVCVCDCHICSIANAANNAGGLDDSANCVFNRNNAVDDDSDDGDDDDGHDKAEAAVLLSLGLDEAGLADIDLKELNRRLRANSVPKEMRVRMKDWRRRIKNRRYAASKREREIVEDIVMLDEISELEAQEENNEQHNDWLIHEILDVQKRLDVESSSSEEDEDEKDYDEEESTLAEAIFLLDEQSEQRQREIEWLIKQQRAGKSNNKPGK